MTTTADRIERPAWAEETLRDTHVRKLEAHARGIWESGRFVSGTQDPSQGIWLELVQLHDSPVELQTSELSEAWLRMDSPASAREIARALLAAADEWERLTGDDR